MGTCGSLLTVHSDPGLGEANRFNISHTSSSASFPPEQKAKQQGSIELLPAKGGPAQRKGRCCLPAPVKRIKQLFQEEGVDSSLTAATALFL